MLSIVQVRNGERHTPFHNTCCFDFSRYITFALHQLHQETLYIPLLLFAACDNPARDNSVLSPKPVHLGN